MTDAASVIREYAEDALTVMVRELFDNYDDLVELAIERSGPGSIGEAEYGDASFHKTPLALTRERFEEYADAIFYACVERHIIERE